MTTTLLPDGHCNVCHRYFQLQFSGSGVDPDWFEQPVYYPHIKPTKPFNNLMDWIDSGLCAKCYVEKRKETK